MHGNDGRRRGGDRGDRRQLRLVGSDESNSSNSTTPLPYSQPDGQQVDEFNYRLLTAVGLVEGASAGELASIAGLSAEQVAKMLRAKSLRVVSAVQDRWS
jgi:hypothetical protein